MATFVLVHGAFHGAWCWERVTPLLEGEGHHVVAPDLPGHGERRSAVSDMTLESYAATVQQSIVTAREPVVLVGHSMGGMVVTQVAEHVPDRISRVVYLSAFLPADGQSLVELAGSVEGADKLQPHLVIDAEAGTCVVAKDAQRAVFYGECSEEDAALAMGKLVPESLAALGAPVSVSDGAAGRVPRAYIECLRDGAITVPLQRSMHARIPCDPVLQIDTDHSPFLSRPTALAEHLLALA